MFTFQIYRCWVVYGRTPRVIIFPSLMWIGGFICTILQLYWQTVQTGALGTGKWEPVNMSIGLGTVLTPFWATTILLNAYTTCGCFVYSIFRIESNFREDMLIRRLYRAAEPSEIGATPGSTHTFNFLCKILAESGFLYFITTFAHFIVWWTPSDLAIRLASQIVSTVCFDLPHGS